ncbi:hypothetical protein Tco_1307196, partial [Tanacetum coccineum]
VDVALIAIGRASIYTTSWLENVNFWKPSEIHDPDDIYGIDLDTSLPRVVMKWKTLKGRSGFDQPACSETTQLSIFGGR